MGLSQGVIGRLYIVLRPAARAQHFPIMLHFMLRGKYLFILGINKGGRGAAFVPT
jgi:hypothetical protein